MADRPPATGCAKYTSMKGGSVATELPEMTVGAAGGSAAAADGNEHAYKPCPNDDAEPGASEYVPVVRSRMRELITNTSSLLKRRFPR